MKSKALYDEHGTHTQFIRYWGLNPVKHSNIWATSSFHFFFIIYAPIYIIHRNGSLVAMRRLDRWWFPNTTFFKRDQDSLRAPGLGWKHTRQKPSLSCRRPWRPLGLCGGLLGAQRLHSQRPRTRRSCNAIRAHQTGSQELPQQY